MVKIVHKYKTLEADYYDLTATIKFNNQNDLEVFREIWEYIEKTSKNNTTEKFIEILCKAVNYCN